jgi:uncharacterized protein YneR
LEEAVNDDDIWVFQKQKAKISYGEVKESPRWEKSIMSCGSREPNEGK